MTARNTDATWVQFKSPRPGATVCSIVDVKGEVIGPVSKVQFLVDGDLVAETDSSAPTFSWDTTAASPGVHTLTLLAINHVGGSGVATQGVYVERRK